MASVALTFGIATIFTGLEAKLGGIVLKPFDLAAVICLPILIAAAAIRPAIPAMPSSLLVLAFFAIHTASAFSVNTGNGIRELVQTIELLMLYVTLLAYRGDVDWARSGKLLILLCMPPLIYTISWHIANGHTVGWKGLGNTKMLFLFLPSLVCAVLVFARRRFAAQEYLILGLLACLVIASGERKALFNLVIIMAVLAASGYLDVLRLAVGLAGFIGVAAAIITTNTYAERQLQSILALANSQDVSVAQLTMGYIPSSISNAQRVFALEISQYLFERYPLFGVGTNAYEKYVKGAYAELPPYLLVSIHNEFQRILVENGIVGLTVYVLVWVRCLLFAFTRLWAAPRPYVVSYLFLFSAFLHYCMFEGSGNESFIALVFIAVMPELYAAALRSVRIRV